MIPCLLYESFAARSTLIFYGKLTSEMFRFINRFVAVNGAIGGLWISNIMIYPKKHTANAKREV